jgi:hypothetical protein
MNSETALLHKKECMDAHCIFEFQTVGIWILKNNGRPRVK